MTQHYPRKYATDARIDGERTMIYVFNCCGEIHKFRSRAGRDRFAAEHKPKVHS